MVVKFSYLKNFIMGSCQGARLAEKGQECPLEPIMLVFTFGGFSSSHPLFRIEASEHLSSHMEPMFITWITTSEKDELINIIMYVKHLISPVAWNDS